MKKETKTMILMTRYNRDGVVNRELLPAPVSAERYVIYGIKRARKYLKAEIDRLRKNYMDVSDITYVDGNDHALKIEFHNRVVGGCINGLIIAEVIKVRV